MDKGFRLYEKFKYLQELQQNHRLPDRVWGEKSHETVTLKEVCLEIFKPLFF